MTDIQINDEYLTTLDEFLKNLQKNWKISRSQEERIREHGGLVGTTQYYIQKKWNNEAKEVENVRVPFVVGNEWVTDILKSGKLMIRFTGGYSTYGGFDWNGNKGRSGVIPRVYLSAK
jgi:hypothetical protein